MTTGLMSIFRKLFSADAPAKIARRLKVMAIARSIVRVNPLFAAVSYQLRIFPVRLGAEYTAIVIGAGGGIGEAIIRQLMQRGCLVIGTYRNHSPALPAEERLRLFRMDITSVRDVDEVYAQLRGMGVKADLIVVATGINSGQDYHASLETDVLTSDALDREREDIMKSFEGNTLGPYLVIRRFAGLIPKRPSRHRPVPQICLLSSSLGTMNNELYGGMYGYRTGKGALHALAMAMYCDLNLEGPVGVQILGPGNVATRMNVGGRISPDVAAQEIIKNVEYSARNARFQFLGVGGKRIAW
jgi:NAD(P)-dependent dehydrogenase (short-subunit alcohol dehydrogenase family)